MALPSAWDAGKHSNPIKFNTTYLALLQVGCVTKGTRGKTEQNRTTCAVCLAFGCSRSGFSCRFISTRRLFSFQFLFCVSLHYFLLFFYQVPVEYIAFRQTYSSPGLRT